MDSFILDASSASIKGECLIKGYKDQIEVLSFSHGVAQQVTTDQSNTKRTSGKPTHQDFTISKYVDLASCKLVDFCNQAKPIPKLKLIICQNSAGAVEKIFEYEMTDALVSSVSTGGGGGKPTETVTFNYTKMSWTYHVQKSDVGEAGSAAATWNLATNAAA